MLARKIVSREPPGFQNFGAYVHQRVDAALIADRRLWCRSESWRDRRRRRCSRGLPRCRWRTRPPGVRPFRPAVPNGRADAGRLRTDAEDRRHPGHGAGSIRGSPPAVRARFAAGPPQAHLPRPEPPPRRRGFRSLLAAPSLWLCSALHATAPTPLPATYWRSLPPRPADGRPCLPNIRAPERSPSPDAPATPGSCLPTRRDPRQRGTGNVPPVARRSPLIPATHAPTPGPDRGRTRPWQRPTAASGAWGDPAAARHDE